MILTKGNIRKLLAGDNDMDLRIYDTVLQCHEDKLLYFVKRDPDAKMTVVAYSLPAKDHITHKHISEFYLRSPPTGYINKENKTGVLQIERQPTRKFKIGLSNYNTHCHLISAADRKQPTHFNDILSETGIQDMVNNKYPSWDSVLKSLIKKPNALALTRNLLATSNELGIILIRHYEELIGWVAPGDRKIKLAKSKNIRPYHEFLQEKDIEIHA